MVELAPLLVPPRQGGADPVGMSDERPAAALIVTYASSRVDLGKRIEISPDGFVVGGPGSAFEVEGAQGSTSRLSIRWGDQSASGHPQWRIEATGDVWINGEAAALGTLRSKDEIRVVDTFFRFLSGRAIYDDYVETIYHMTIRDMPTGLANLRFLQEALERELSRARRDDRRLALIALRFELSVGVAHSVSHDILREAGDHIRNQGQRDWFAARTSDLEILVVAPEATKDEAQRQARIWLEACRGPIATKRFGTAELGEGANDVNSLIAMARADAM